MFLDKERIIARDGFNRWLVPPAALAIHLSIGMAYGFSVFWLPLSKAVGIAKPVPYPAEMSLIERVFSSSHDWSVSMLGWMYTLFFVFLGLSAAVFGRWVEQAGPRKAGLAAAACWGGGLMISSLGVYLHQIALLWIGSGVIGGIGLGLGYISPVSTLIKWFPDRRGLATGLAIMGFGGGAMIGAPLAQRLMLAFATDRSVGVWQTFLLLGLIHLMAMSLGAIGYRLPPPAWKPSGMKLPATASPLGNPYVPVGRVHRTPQFWYAWGVLCLNVSAGIGVIGMASPMLQEVFGGRLIGVEAPLGQLSKSQAEQVALIAAAFAGLLSLFNILGRIAWASVSDYLGRKPTYTIFFLLGAGLYAAAPWAGKSGSVALFVILFCVILTMYGGGFATIPAYLADLFGAQNISAIHGRLLTAWSVAGILGPVAVNYLRDWQLAQGVPPSEVYSITLYILAGMLVIGLGFNLMIRKVDSRHFIPAEEPMSPTVLRETNAPMSSSNASSPLLIAAAWLAVGLPMGWGVWQTLIKTKSFFE